MSDIRDTGMTIGGAKVYETTSPLPFGADGVIVLQPQRFTSPYEHEVTVPADLAVCQRPPLNVMACDVPWPSWPPAPYVPPTTYTITWPQQLSDEDVERIARRVVELQREGRARADHDPGDEHGGCR